MFSPDATPHGVPTELMAAVRSELLRLAGLQEAIAALEAADIPYWVPCSVSVVGHRAAADALREDADRLLIPAA